MDLVCMPHVLEFSQNPHQTLREVERILVPEGTVILTGFNPYSFWGLRRRLSRSMHYPWQGRHFSLARIKDWLALLGFELIVTGTVAHRLPINDPVWMHRLEWMDKGYGAKCCALMGGVYYLVAKKRVVNMTLLKPNWKNTTSQLGLVTNTSKARPIKREE
jgi:SAM-dependent methyltransferase